MDGWMDGWIERRDKIRHLAAEAAAEAEGRNHRCRRRREEEKQAMAALPSLYSSSISRSSRRLEFSLPSSSSSSCSSSSSLLFLPRTSNVTAGNYHHLTTKRKKFHGIITRVNATVEEEEEEETGTTTLVPEGAAEAEQPVSVPVSPSDILTMFFAAEGTMNDSDVPKVISALEKIEGVSDLQVQVQESIASVELTKQTTVQATGVASNLVEVIQGSGFKLQTLNLSFTDEEDNIDTSYFE